MITWLRGPLPEFRTVKLFFPIILGGNLETVNVFSTEISMDFSIYPSGTYTFQS